MYQKSFRRLYKKNKKKRSCIRRFKRKLYQKKQKSCINTGENYTKRGESCIKRGISYIKRVKRNRIKKDKIVVLEKVIIILKKLKAVLDKIRRSQDKSHVVYNKIGGLQPNKFR